MRFFPFHPGALAALLVPCPLVLADLSTEILDDNPVAYWRLDDAATPALDSTASMLHADAFGTVTFGNPSLFLNDANPSVGTSGNGALLTFPFEKMDGGGFTVEFWIKFNSLPTGFTNLVGDGEGGGDFNLMVYAGAGGFLRPHLQTSAGVTALDSTDRVIVGAVHHVVSTWDSTTGELTLYLDGVPAATTLTAGTNPNAGTPSNTDNQIYIGQDGRELRAPDATFDEVAIYNHPLTADRVAAHYAAVEVPDPPDPPDPPANTGVAVGSSTLIGTLDYSDSFTIGAEATVVARQSYGAQGFPLPAGVDEVEDGHGNPAQFWGTSNWSIATDAAVNPGGFGYPGGSGAGSETGMTQRGGGGDWSIPYGLRDVFVVQSDFIQLPDRVDFTIGATPNNIFGGGNISIFFRTTGFTPWGEIGIFNGAVETNTGLTSGIPLSRLWQNYALLVDVPNQTIDVFVNEVSRGVIDLNTIGGGAYAGILNNAFVGIGGSGADRLWSDNFQVGAPGTAQPAAPPALTAVDFDPGTEDLTLTWNSRPGTDYKVEFSIDLINWLELVNPVDSGGQTTILNLNLSPILGAFPPPKPDTAFFRVTDNNR